MVYIAVSSCRVRRSELTRTRTRHPIELLLCCRMAPRSAVSNVNCVMTSQLIKEESGAGLKGDCSDLTRSYHRMQPHCTRYSISTVIIIKICFCLSGPFRLSQTRMIARYVKGYPHRLRHSTKVPPAAGPLRGPASALLSFTQCTSRNRDTSP